MITNVKLDKKFFTELFETYANDVRKSLQRQRIPERDREDLVQEVFAIAVRKYELRFPAKAWLLMVAHNLTKNYRRRPYRREVTDCEAEPVEHRSPEQDASDREIHDCVHSVIDSLPDDLRIVLTLAYIEGISFEEIAKLLNVTPSKVQSMLRRAREAFIEEGRRRHAAGALLSVFPLLAFTAENRLRALIHECLRHVGSAAVGAGIALALLHPQSSPATLILAERTGLAEIRWEAIPAPPVVDVPHPPEIDLIPQPAIDLAPATPVARPAIDPTPQPLDEVDESARDELALMDRATWTMQRGNYEEARRALERHRRIYPDGKLSARRNQLMKQLKQLTGRSKKISG